MNLWEISGADYAHGCDDNECTAASTTNCYENDENVNIKSHPSGSFIHINNEKQHSNYLSNSSNYICKTTAASEATTKDLILDKGEKRLDFNRHYFNQDENIVDDDSYRNEINSNTIENESVYLSKNINIIKSNCDNDNDCMVQSIVQFAQPKGNDDTSGSRKYKSKHKPSYAGALAETRDESYYKNRGRWMQETHK